MPRMTDGSFTTRVYEGYVELIEEEHPGNCINRKGGKLIEEEIVCNAKSKTCLEID